MLASDDILKNNSIIKHFEIKKKSFNTSYIHFNGIVTRILFYGIGYQKNIFI